VGFGRKVRNLVGSKDYRQVFDKVNLQADSKAAGRWNTNRGGEYFAIGVGGAVTGKGADLLIIDDQTFQIAIDHPAELFRHDVMMIALDEGGPHSPDKLQEIFLASLAELGFMQSIEIIQQFHLLLVGKGREDIIDLLFQFHGRYVSGIPKGNLPPRL